MFYLEYKTTYPPTLINKLTGEEVWLTTSSEVALAKMITKLSERIDNLEFSIAELKRIKKKGKSIEIGF
jgi:hypothetical protein